MDSVVLDVLSVQPALVSEILLKLLVDVIFYVSPADPNTNVLSKVTCLEEMLLKQETSQ